ncbi:MAG TPA: hypothetical protein PLO16_14140 [Acidocella sp.]|nr:hypothetical protein [Acidocella sp.]
MSRNICVILCVLCLLVGGNSRSAAASLPYVNCEISDQPEQVAPPKEVIDISLPVAIAAKLAYYYFHGDIVLAPRGWSCFDKSHFGSTLEILEVNPKDSNSPIYGVYSGSIINGTIGNQAEIYDWTKAYFPQFPQYVPDQYQVGPGTFSSREEISTIPRYPSDTLRNNNPFLVRYLTQRFNGGIGLYIIDHVMNTQAKRQSPAVPIQGFIAISTSPQARACTLFLYAMTLPPEFSELEPYLLEEKEHKTDTIIQSGQGC